MTEIDPFSATAAGIDDDDIFGDPKRSSYPAIGSLLHKLLIMTPVKMEMVPDNNNPGKMQERWSIDTVVIHEDGSADEYDAMYWSHKSIALAAAKAQKDRRPMLGTLHLFPVQATKKTLPTEDLLLADEDIQRWLARGKGLPPTPVAWALEPATPDQKKVAIAWWKANRNPFGG